MQRIKFRKEKQDFVAELRSTVKEYFETKGIERYGSSEILVKTLLMSALYFTPFVLMLTGVFSGLLTVLISWVLMGFGMSGLGLVTMHDANHGSFSKYKWVNKLFSGSLYLLGGFPANWKFQHNTLHHGFTNVEGHDEDIRHGGILRFSPHKPLKKIHRFQYIYAWFFYGLMTFSWITAKDFKQFSRYKKMNVLLNGDRKYNSLFAGLIVSKVLYYAVFLALPLMVIPVAWYWVLAGFFMMHFTSGFLLSIIFQTAHVVPTSEYPLPDEDSFIDKDRLIHQLHTTSDFAPRSRVFSWLIGGLNYQVVHHLFPYVSHVHYKNISKLIKEVTKSHNQPYFVNRTFVGAVYQHLLMLKSLGRA